MVSPSYPALNTTHDISRTPSHLPDLKTFGEIVTNAVKGAFPNNTQTRYKDVRVLLLSWQDSNVAGHVNFLGELLDLKKVFEDLYHYKCEEWRIPSKKPHRELDDKLGQFIKEFDAQETLLIVYYGGHGGMNEDRTSIWTW